MAEKYRPRPLPPHALNSLIGHQRYEFEVEVAHHIIAEFGLPKDIRGEDIKQEVADQTSIKQKALKRHATKVDRLVQTRSKAHPESRRAYRLVEKQEMHETAAYIVYNDLTREV